MKYIILLIFLLQYNIYAEDFPIIGHLKERVSFWTKVYTEITTEEAFLHDSEDLNIIYKKVNLPSSRKSRKRELNKIRRDYAAALRRLAQKRGLNLDPLEKKIYEIVGERSKKSYFEMAKNLRFQYGLKDRYYTGLINSYQYIDKIESIFKKYGLPKELIYLPHVESSFNYHASSKVGAAGIWQFMRSTARLYGLKVNYSIDERRDVFKATIAAAKLLRDNYRTLKTWPLALTAYNHGPNSVKRAVKKLETTKIHEIISKYEGSRFGFASKNFYATFMATVLISKDPEKYFPAFKKPTPFTYDEIPLYRSYTIDHIVEATGMTKEILKKYNPSIRSSAFKSPIYLPKDFILRVPHISNAREKEIASRFKDLEYAPQDLTADKLHIISRGENLYDIARLYRVSLNDLIYFNSINNPSRIFAGMRLRIPGKKSLTKKDKVVITEKKVELPSKGPIIKALTESEEKDPQKVIVHPSKLSLESYHLDLTPKGDNLYEITIETEETLGHFAEWAKVGTQSIRSLNGLSYGSNIFKGQKLKIKLPTDRVETFKQLRNEYHLAIQEDFFESFKLISEAEYTVKKGDHFGKILKTLDLPFWLLRKTEFEKNQKELTDNIVVNQKITYPVVEELSR